MSLLLMHGRESGLVRAGLEAYYDFRKTNLLRYSEQFDNAAWGTGPVTPNVSTSSNGEMTADLVSDASAAAAQEFFQSAPIVSSADSYTFSVFVKKHTDEARFPEFRIQATGGTVQPLTTGHLNTKTGTFQKTSGSGTMAVTDEGGYWRVALVETDSNSGNTQVRCAILPAFTDVLGNPVNVALTGSITVWGAQLNAGPSALAYEKTDTNQTAVDSSGKANHGTLGPTSAAESNDPIWRTGRVRLDGVNDYVLTPSAVTANADELTLQIVFQKTPGSVSGGHRTLFGHNAGGSYIRFFTDTTIGFWLSATVTSAFVQGPGGGIPDDGLWKMMTFRWRAGVVQEQILNLDTSVKKETAAPSDGLMDSTYRAIGTYAGGNYFAGEVATALYYRRFLSDAELGRNYAAVKAGLAPRGISLP
ncbi:MAG: hypothetical protein O2968_07990 [Acidobacteria bacterium]|nr:hypothetical protein [Acidobacteriota bacterium]